MSGVRTRSRWLPWRGAVAGGLLGLAAFAAEAAAVMRAGAVGFRMNLDGPAAALMAAVRPQLPGLLARVLLLYVAGGLLLGLVAALLARVALSRAEPAAPSRREWLAVGLELGWLVPVLLTAKAISRPALFDDVPLLRGPLELLVEHGEPWHPLAVLALGAGVHGAWLLRRPGVFSRARSLGMTASLVVLALVGIRWRAAAETRHPLVVVIGIDAFRPDRLRALGATREVAPNLERFLGDATLFTRAYTPIGQTEPAWRSLLTARWPHRTGVRYPLTDDARWAALPTLPGALAGKGWQTSFATDCSRFNFQTPLSGFAERLQPPRGALNFALEKLRFRGVGVLGDHALGAALLPEFIDNRALAGIHDPMGYARRLAATLTARAERGPALFVFHATAAHFPGDPVHPFYRRYVSRSEPLERRLRMFFSPIGAGARGGWNQAGAEALYDELLAQADAQVGLLLEALKASGRYDEALIVVLSDHGESFHSDHPELAGATPVHGARLSEEENRILLAVKLPGQRPPRAVVDSLVRLIDVAPTVLDVVGLPALEGAEGRSLLPLLRGEPDAPRYLYAETGFTHASPDAFDPDHRAGAPRSFDAYRIAPDGVISLGPTSHEAVLAEKDVGAFDGRRWWIRSPRKSGEVTERCVGECVDADALRAWLDETR